MAKPYQIIDTKNESLERIVKANFKELSDLSLRGCSAVKMNDTTKNRIICDVVERGVKGKLVVTKELYPNGTGFEILLQDMEK